MFAHSIRRKKVQTNIKILAASSPPPCSILLSHNSWASDYAVYFLLVRTVVFRLRRRRSPSNLHRIFVTLPICNNYITSVRGATDGGPWRGRRRLGEERHLVEFAAMPETNLPYLSLAQKKCSRKIHGQLTMYRRVPFHKRILLLLLTLSKIILDRRMVGTNIILRRRIDVLFLPPFPFFAAHPSEFKSLPIDSPESGV